jgi:hypothetical protein
MSLFESLSAYRRVRRQVDKGESRGRNGTPESRVGRVPGGGQCE